jgi:hypothetical protein
MSKYRETEPRRLVCNEAVGGCGEVFEASVKIHKKTGIAGVTCPECGKTQEPIDAEVRK